MKKLIVLVLLLVNQIGFSQTQRELWAETETISTQVYEFQVPISWRNFEEMMSGGKGPEQFFEASGKGLPISFKGGPVKVSIFLVKLDKMKSLKKAKKSIIKGYFENSDRVFEKKKDYSEKIFKLSDNSNAVILNTRFYRTSKGLNQSRYDLTAFSEKHRIAYMFTVSIQYVDKSYAFEIDNDLMGYAEKLFETFKWK